MVLLQRPVYDLPHEQGYGGRILGWIQNSANGRVAYWAPRMAKEIEMTKKTETGAEVVHALLALQEKMKGLEEAVEHWKAGIPVHTLRDSECVTVDDWRRQAMYYESNWSRCSHDFNAAVEKLNAKISDLTEAQTQLEAERSLCTEYIEQRNEAINLLAAERSKVKRLVEGIKGIARTTDSKAELSLRVSALLTELGEG